MLRLLAACQKYEMDSIQSLIRTKVKSGEFPAPKGTEVFAAYAIASGNGLIPDMDNAARLTVYHPMTFDTLGEGLRLFEGKALRDLANFRWRCRDNLVTCINLYLEVGLSGPSTIWVGCPEVMPSTLSPEEFQQSRALPNWLKQLFSSLLDRLNHHKFTYSLMGRSSLWEKGDICTAFESHADCSFCLRIQAINGVGYRLGLNDNISQAIEKALRLL